MVFQHGYLVVKRNRTVTLYKDLLGVGGSKFASLSHIDCLGELVSELVVDNGVGVDRHQDFITFTMNADRVVVVSVRAVTRGRELHVDVLGHACGQHTFLVEPNFEIWCLRRQHVEPLRCGRVVNYSHL